MADDATDTTVTTTETVEAPLVDAPVTEPAAPPPVDTPPAETSILGGQGDAPTEPAAEEKPADGPPEAYELTAPEGLTLDADTVSDATPVFKELNLNNEQAQKLIPVAAKFAERIAQRGQQQMLAESVALRAAWAEEAKADPEIGGAKWDETVSTAAKALDALGYPKGSSFRSFLTDTGLGNHPEMIRAMVRVGKQVGEDSDFVRGDRAAPPESNAARILYPNDLPKGQ